MPDKYHELLEIDSQSCPVKQTTWSEIRGLERSRRQRRGRWTGSVRKSVRVTSAAAIVLCCGVVGSAFLSPTMAYVLKQLPVVRSLLPDFTNPVVKAVSTNRNTSVTDQGITVTVTNAYYDKHKLDLLYTVRVPGNYSPVSGTQLPIGNVQMNGTALYFAGAIGGDKLFASGDYQGDWDFQGLTGDLPDQGTLNVTIPQIGNVKGTWRLSVPVSSKAVQQRELSMSPSVSKTYDDLTLTIQTVTLGPVSTVVNYRIAQPIDQRGNVKYDPNQFSMAVFDETGTMLIQSSKAPFHSHVEGNTQVTDFTITLNSPPTKPTALTFKPSYTVMHHSPSQNVVLPYTGKFPIVFDEGSYGTTTVTSIEFQKGKTLVSETLGKDTLEHPPVWFEDAQGRKYEYSQTETEDGKLVYPPMNANGLKVCSQTAPTGSGAYGESKEIENLDMTIHVRQL